MSVILDEISEVYFQYWFNSKDKMLKVPNHHRKVVVPSEMHNEILSQ